MNGRGRAEREESRAVSDAIARLRSMPAIAREPAALAAVDELVRRIDPASIEKTQRLARVAQLVNSSLDLETVLAQALATAVEVMHADRGFIVLRDRAAVAVLHNMEPLAVQTPSRSIVERVMQTGEPTFTTDAQTDPRWNAKDSILALHLRSIACVPLVVRTEIIGAVYLDSLVVPGLFDTGDRDLLATFANEAAIAIENARLFEQERARGARIAELQAFQTRILEAIASGVVTLSPSHTITTFNRAAETLFDLPAGRIVGKTLVAITRLIPDFPELLQMFLDSGAVALRAEVEAFTTDGTQLTLEMQLAPLESDGGLGVAIAVNDVTKQRRLEDAVAADRLKAHKIRESFSRYLAPHVVKTLMEEPNSIRLGGERRLATTLFADVRGFTAMAAGLEAERVVEILNTYFEEAVRIVFECEGLLDKFYGDGLMAVFGPPLVRPDDAARAVKAAILLHEVVERLGPRLDYPLQISAGLATGDVVAGHFGGLRRMDYTVIGDAVNLASGLQSAAPAGAIYCDEATIAAAGTISRPLQKVSAQVKGRKGLVPAYAIVPTMAKTN